ncbi:MAG: cytochrome P450 [Dermatophilus congolensis]|nr:cytochrome P450 [Dermatophilus congolensis]
MSVDTSVATSDLDLFAEEVLADRDPYFAKLREIAPVVYLPANDAYALTRYEVIRSALADPETFSSTKVAWNDDMNNALQGTSLATDPPDHAPLRAVLSRNLAPRALRPLKAEIDEKADRLVASLVEKGSFDVVPELSRAFPLQIVSDLIGVTGVARDNILRWGDAAFNVLGPMNQRTIENFPIAGEFFQWTMQVRAEDLTEGSLGREIFAAADRGEIPADAAGHIIHQYVAAGMDTTIASIGNAIKHLGNNPEQYAILRDDPSLVPSAFAEVLRYEPPVHAFARLVTRDVEVEGTLLPAGSRAAVLFAAGNRDPRHYENAEVFDVRRNPVDHLAFGYGIHGCAGQGLARLEAHAVLAALITYVETFEVGTPVQQPTNMTRTMKSLPFTVTKRA